MEVLMDLVYLGIITGNSLSLLLYIYDIDGGDLSSDSDRDRSTCFPWTGWRQAAAAESQAKRIAKERGLDESKVQALIAKYTEGRQLGILSEPRVNVLKLNLVLDDLK